jgi:hypothetical protein
MARGDSYARELRKPRWATRGQLLPQMRPLERDLVRADRNGPNRPDGTDLGLVEGIAAPRGLALDRREIRVDGEARIGMRLEAIELGM